MRVRSVLREARRNVASGTSRASLFGTLLFAITVTLALSDLLTVRQIVDDAREFQRRAGSIMTLEAASSIDGETCDQLSAIRGIRASGAFRDTGDKLRPSSLPNSPIALLAVSAGFGAVLGSNADDGGGILLGPDVASALSLGRGDLIVASDESTRAAGEYAYPQDGRRRGFGYAALTISVDDRPFDECWVDVWPQNTNSSTLLLMTVRPGALSDGEVKPVLGQLNASMGEYFDGPQRFQSRLTMVAAPLAACAGFLLAFVSIRLRRVELASAMHAGVARPSLLAMLAVETGVWAGLSTLATVAVAIVASSSMAAVEFYPMVVLASRVPVLAMVGVMAGMMVAIAGVREKHLFRYFRAR